MRYTFLSLLFLDILLVQWYVINSKGAADRRLAKYD